MNEIRFDEKVAVITGAGAGLGRTYALELARRGAKIVVNDLGGSKDGSGSGRSAADSVVEEIRKAGGTAVPSYDSVASVSGGESIIRTAVEAFGTLDILINNAGIVRDHSLVKMTEDEWDLLYQVHLKGAYCLTKPALSVMKEKNYGRVIFTSSGVGLYGNFGQANYAAMKMGLIGFMNALKIEMAKFNVKLNTIAPNAASRLTEDVFPPNIREKLKPEAITPLVLYLASDRVQESGMIFNCMGGWYSRAVMMCTDGVLIDGGKPVTPEDIAQNWEAITSLENPKPLGTIVESFGYIASLLSDAPA